MELKSMKLTAAEAQETAPVEAKAAAPKYPWGLRLELNGDSMKKLGLSELPEVGETMTLQAKVVVERVSQNDTVDGGKRQDMSLQITDMSLSASSDEETPTENKLYKTGGQPADNTKPGGKTILVEL